MDRDCANLLDEDYQICQLVSYAHRLLTTARQRKLKKYKLTSSTVAILTLLTDMDHAPRPIEIAKKGKRTPQTVTSILTRMEKQGLLVRIRDENKRNSFKVFLTPRGRLVYQRITGIDTYHKILSTLSEEQRQQLKESLNQIIQAASKYC